MAFQVFGTRSPVSRSNRYAPFAKSSQILKGPSQFAASFPSVAFFRASAVFRQTKSPSINCRGCTFVLYLLATNLFWASFLIPAAFLHSSNTSRSILSYSSFKLMSFNCLHTVGSPTSIGSMSSIPYVKWKGNSPVEPCGEQRYPRNTWSISSTHPPLASP